MTRLPFLVVATVLLALAGNGVCAQSANGVIGGSRFNPPPPPPPPGPDIRVPEIPKMDVPSRQVGGGMNVPRSSFSDRVVRCLDDAAAAGLGPADRAAYSRACANQ
jgi:hypothetical protein